VRCFCFILFAMLGSAWFGDRLVGKLFGCFIELKRCGTGVVLSDNGLCAENES